MNYRQLVRSYVPRISDAEADFILWERTAFPLVNLETLKKQLEQKAREIAKKKYDEFYAWRTSKFPDDSIQTATWEQLSPAERNRKISDAQWYLTEVLAILTSGQPQQPNEIPEPTPVNMPPSSGGKENPPSEPNKVTENGEPLQGGSEHRAASNRDRDDISPARRAIRAGNPRSWLLRPGETENEHTHEYDELKVAEPTSGPQQEPPSKFLKLLTQARCVGGDVALNLKDAATIYPEHFNVEAVKQLLAKWNELVGAIVIVEMAEATGPASQSAGQCLDCETVIGANGCACGKNRTELMPNERPEGCNDLPTPASGAAQGEHDWGLKATEEIAAKFPDTPVPIYIPWMAEVIRSAQATPVTPVRRAEELFDAIQSTGWMMPEEWKKAAVYFAEKYHAQTSAPPVPRCPRCGSQELMFWGSSSGDVRAQCKADAHHYWESLELIDVWQFFSPALPGKDIESLLDRLCTSEDKTYCQRGRNELREILAGKEPSIQAKVAGWPSECIHGKRIDENSWCDECRNSSLGGRKDGEPMPTELELDSILKRKPNGGLE